MDKFWDALASNMIVLGAFMVPVGIVAVTSYFSHKRTELIHRERMASIEKGMMPAGPFPDAEKDEEEEAEGPKAPPDYLRRGIFWLCPGAALVAFCILFLSEVSAAIRLPILGVSIACAGVGVAHIVIYFIENEKQHAPLAR
jgi:uncharacterized membrane protein HdeD (DUF308 family)